MSRLIKKYKNRRLYDTEISCYITIEELQNYVLEGIDFTVVDSSSGQDLTNSSLVQIFVEMQEGNDQFLSTAMLRQLILLANHPMHKALQQTLEAMLHSLMDTMEKNPLLQNYQRAAKQWQDQTQQILKQWQDLFKS
ncbi:MAG: polyhydroxyalkanoate biosynthesis repressor PhaR [Legionellaceae bacterium]|nr:polyhydroxyalkanoate biosynthesis repressor PhaR [Legionellaceae bacterium]